LLAMALLHGTASFYTAVFDQTQFVDSTIGDIAETHRPLKLVVAAAIYLVARWARV